MAGGRKPIDIDLVELEKLAMLHCTQVEVAAWLDVTQKTVSVKLAQKRYAEVWERGWAKGNISLRRHQFQRAEAGDKTMLIWLGKQWLGQQDRQEITGKDGGPVEHHHVTESELDAEIRRLLGEVADSQEARPQETVTEYAWDNTLESPPPD
jgi:hypothetical protein